MTTSSSTTNSSSVSTADTSSNPPPPPQHVLHHHISNASDNNGASSSGGGGGGAPTTAPRPPLPARAPRVGVGGGGQNQACAACKFQRRKCNRDCQLAPYFPADEQRRFLNAHRLFGVRNIQRTLQRTPPELHSDAMQALTFESDTRAGDPIGGAARVVVELGRQYELLRAELAAVQHHIKLCSQQQAAAAAAANDSLIANPLADPATAMLFTGVGPNQNDDAMVDAFYADQQTAGETSNVQAAGGFQEQYIKDEVRVQPPPQQPYEYFYNGTAGDEGSSHAWSSVGNVQHCGNSGEADELPMGLSDQLHQHCQIEAAVPFDVKPELPTTMNQHHGSVIIERPEQKVLAVAGSSSSSAAAHCQLQLGCSSNAWKMGAHVN